MNKIRISDDLDECRYIWDRIWPKECFFDLWPVRSCFAEAYNRDHRFHIAEQNGEPKGLLALSWIKEKQHFSHFPGETWHGKTWLEQNRIVAKSSKIVHELIESVSGSATISYLTRESIFSSAENVSHDETGYLFFPGQHGYSFDAYMEEFPWKTRKKLNKEISMLEAQEVEFRYDSLEDLDHLFSINQNVFGENSYFSDPRFVESFEGLVKWLHDNNMLRITTVLISGRIAAIDMGAIWRNTYTLLAGATNPDFRGVAKLMNFHHIKWACSKQFDSVDFLCGDFGWKERFRLTPRMLYKLQIPDTGICNHEELFERGFACA